MGESRGREREREREINFWLSKCLVRLYAWMVQSHKYIMSY